jgi:ribonuclease VapC
VTLEPLDAVLDAWAVLAWLQGEGDAARCIDGLLGLADGGEARVRMSLINLGEVYYVLLKRLGRKRADLILGRFRGAPVVIEAADEGRVLAAARLKGRFPLSYADCFAAAMALENGAELFSGDPELRVLEGHGLKLHWLVR